MTRIIDSSCEVVCWAIGATVGLFIPVPGANGCVAGFMGFGWANAIARHPNSVCSADPDLAPLIASRTWKHLVGGAMIVSASCALGCLAFMQTDIGLAWAGVCISIIGVPLGLKAAYSNILCTPALQGVQEEVENFG